MGSFHTLRDTTFKAYIIYRGLEGSRRVVTTIHASNMYKPRGVIQVTYGVHYGFGGVNPASEGFIPVPYQFRAGCVAIEGGHPVFQGFHTSSGQGV